MIKIFNCAASLLLAGSFFCCGVFGGKVASGVEIDGVCVGGMSYAEAERAVRARIGAFSFVVKTPAGEVDATREISCSDDVSSLVRRAKRGEKLSAHTVRHWVGMEDFLYDVCKKNARDAENATLGFSADGFTYSAGENGVACNYDALLRDASRALGRGDTAITLSTYEYAPAITREILEERTQPLSSYMTVFDAENAPRAHNIALAASRISGTVLPPHAEFSFNQTVGERTEKNGFEVAAVIQDGEFLPGVGGGVCQASSTLFNAALCAGMVITQSRPHSLSVGYVPPSLDAMVSVYSDLKFENPYDLPVYILARAESGKVRFSFYGLPDGKRYETESEVLLRVAPPEPQITEGTEERVIRAEKEGIVSESYLLTYEGGALVSRKRIRRDTYAAVQGIVQKPPLPIPDEENGENA